MLLDNYLQFSESMLHHDARESAVVQLRACPQVDPPDVGAPFEDEIDVGRLAVAHDVNLLNVLKYL